GFVFMGVNSAYHTSGPESALACRYCNGSNWSWMDLGYPADTRSFIDSPVAVTWTSSSSGRSYAAAFVVGYNTNWNGYILYERNFSRHDGWSNWIPHFPPVTIVGQLSILWEGAFKFHVTSGVVWTQHNPDGPVERINLFGYRETH